MTVKIMPFLQGPGHLSRRLKPAAMGRIGLKPVRAAVKGRSPLLKIQGTKNSTVSGMNTLYANTPVYPVCHSHAMPCVTHTLCRVSPARYAVCHPHATPCVVRTLCRVSLARQVLQPCMIFLFSVMRIIQIKQITVQTITTQSITLKNRMPMEKD
jgi:hypothetical protein